LEVNNKIRSKSVSFFVVCICFILYKLSYSQTLTNFLFVLLACFNDLLHDGAVPVVLLLKDACLCVAPILGQLSHDDSLLVADLGVNVLLGLFQVLVEHVIVAHQYDHIVGHALGVTPVLVFFHVGNAVELLESVHFQGHAELLHLILHFFDVLASLLLHVLDNLLHTFLEIAR